MRRKKVVEQEGLNLKKYNHRMLLYGAIGLALFGTPLILNRERENNSAQKEQPSVYTAEVSVAPKLTEETAANFSDGLEFKLYYTPQKEWAGAKIRLDRTVMHEWAKYAPVKITIPELSYTAPFPVDNNANSAETKFPSPVTSSGTYHYIVFGWDPRKGIAKELYNYIIFPKTQ